MARLVAITEEPGSAFVTELSRIWDAGDAAFPVDPRLPDSARIELMADLDVGGETQDGDALVLATSGSTGKPKGVVLTHAALEAHAKAVHEHLRVDRDRDRWTACLPLAHVGGLGVVVRALIDDVPLQVLGRFDDDQVDGTLISLVPTVLDRLAPVRVNRFRWIVLGGSADPITRPNNVVHTWGMTESGGGIVYGNRPLPGVEVEAADGELRVRSATLLRCYRDGTDPKNAQGWYATGDLGSVAEDGTVSVTGRRDHLIITGGENVRPESVEAALATVPGVADVAVIGRVDPEWGHRVVALVVPTDRSAPPMLEHLRNGVDGLLPGYAKPREIDYVEAIPRSALGKIRRAEL